MGGKKIQKNIENEKKQWGFQEKKKKRKKWRKKKDFKLSFLLYAMLHIQLLNGEK